MNEAATIGAVVLAAAPFGTPVVIDDGSTDETALLAEHAGAVVVRHQSNRGYDEAINTGFRQAAALGGEVILTLDADGQHDPSLIRQFVDQIESGADLVVGIRNTRPRLAEHLFAAYTRLRFGIRDPLCGMKAYRRTVYDACGHFDSYGSIGTELALFAARRGYRIQQLPLAVRARKDSPRFGRSFSANYRILRALMLSWSIR